MEIVMPSRVDAEKTILGSILADEKGEVLHRLVAVLRPDSFSTDSHRRIFAAMAVIGESGKQVDYITLTDELLRRKQLESVGGMAYLEDLVGLMALTATDGGIDRCSTIINEKARLRRLISACQTGISRAQEPGASPAECASVVQEALLSIEAEESRTTAKPVREIMSAVRNELEAQSKSAGLVGMHTGIPSLDEATTGIRPGELWVVGALPGRGKTAIGAQILLANGMADNPSAVFSIEMSSTELGKRFLAACSHIGAGKIRNPKYIPNEAWPAVIAAAGEIAQLPIYVDDSPSLRIEELLARARLYIRRFGVRLIVVDYLRLVEAPGKDLRERVGRVADSLRQLAKSEKVGVVLLSQLRRPEGGINSRPNMLELKESGDIEAHAHVVLLLYMPTSPDGIPTGEEELILGKNRNGCLGSVRVHFDTKRLQFNERE